jgi:hypothetical protein
MLVLVTLTIGLALWITAWALGIKAIDAFLVAMALVVGATAVQVFAPYVKRALGIGDEAGST